MSYRRKVQVEDSLLLQLENNLMTLSFINGLVHTWTADAPQ